MNFSNTIWQDKHLIHTLTDGGVVVIPTDTVYGIVCKATNPTAVARVYDVRKRASEKPCIILVGYINELEKFAITLTNIQREELRKFWPGPVSVRLDCPSDNFTYLHRGTNSLVFRMPAPESLQDLLRKTGPLIAPSANTEGNPVSKNIQEAKSYFGDLVDLYVDGGEIEGHPSKIINLSKDGLVSIIRE